jgi:hypothetical protein
MNPSIASDNTVTAGQIESCVTLVTDATRKAAGTALRELAQNGLLTKQNVERIRGRGNEVVAAISQLMKQIFADMAENISGCLKLISGAETLTIGETDGTATIAEASALFTGYLDSDFKNSGLDVKAKPTTSTNVAVYEMVKNGNFGQIFGGLSNNLDSLCLTQAQIIEFVKHHGKWLRTDGYATLFLFKVDKEFFVASVHLNPDLGVYVRRFGNVEVCFAVYRRRVVVPQLAPIAP